MRNEQRIFSCLYPLIEDNDQGGYIIVLWVVIWLRKVLLFLPNFTIPKTIAACTIIHLTDDCSLAHIDLMILKGGVRQIGSSIRSLGSVHFMRR